jgi:hypothetical protein
MCAISQRPSKEDYEEFLIQVVYGPCTDYLKACIKGAYLDVCRTMRGFAKLPKKETAKNCAMEALSKRLKELRDDENVHDRKTFDIWHKSVSDQIVEIVKKESGFEIAAGQTQKWINMALKNIFVCGERRIPGFSHLYEQCHMPIDNIILGELKKKGVRRPVAEWSKWKYDEYYLFQEDLRVTFSGRPLLDAEHLLWLAGRNR